jgi:diguanylate cyclase (GGDEF)-like protein
MMRNLEPGNRDALTGAASEAALLRFTEAVLELAQHPGPPLGFLLIDIDGLAEIATHLGAPAAEAVLLGIADRLHEGVRGHDLVGRIGNGFGICMPDLLPAQARGAAERLRRALAGAPVPTPAGELGVTCSIGLALAHGPISGAAALLAQARLAMLEAQLNGGDRVVAAD